eukprot:2290546-Rhodomonas_salina.1
MGAAIRTGCCLELDLPGTGQMSVVNGQTSMANGQWSTVVDGQPSVKTGHWSLVTGQLSPPAQDAASNFEPR